MTMPPKDKSFTESEVKYLQRVSGDESGISRDLSTITGFLTLSRTE